MLSSNRGLFVIPYIGCTTPWWGRGGGRGEGGNYFSEGVNHKPAVSKKNFSKDVSKKVQSSAQIPKEEATAGEAAARRRNIWKLWETLIQVGQRDAVCLPCKSFLGQLHRKALYEIREVATPGVDEV